MSLNQWLLAAGIVIVSGLLAAYLLRAKPDDAASTAKPSGQTISDCLADQRPDMAVSKWLQARVANQHPKALPHEVLVAYRADRFLSEVNSGGYLGFFGWEYDWVADTVQALEEVGLTGFAEDLRSAMRIVGPKGWPASKEAFEKGREAVEVDEQRSAALDALDQRLMEGSAKVEQATHAYIRLHIEAFKKLD